MANEVPVFVMLPLDSVDSVTSEPERSRFKKRLGDLKNAGVEGVMMDVWWGLVERDAPREYNWSAYRDLLKMVGDCGLKVQAVMSFHKCGGNVGDPVTIPLPPWVVKEILQNNDLAYTDKWYSSLKDERPNDEYISLGCDDLPLLGLGQRTPVQCYADFMRSFKENFTDLMGKTVVEIQVGMGPAGELRYPSYPLSKWKFPGIGAFQCYDKYMQANLKARAKAIGKEEWGHAPTDAGDYNSLPEKTGFFCCDGGWRSPYGQFFLNWYFSMLLDHGERILATAKFIFRSSGVRLSGKVAGIHWHYLTTSRAPELTAGYYNTIDRDGYLPIAQMFRRYAVVFNFTCIEMKDKDQPADAHCSPEKLVEQVIQATREATIRLAGENALPRFDGAAYTQIRTISRRVPLCAFTYLRMSEPLFVEKNWITFMSFVRSMSDKNAVSIPRDGKQRGIRPLIQETTPT